MTWVKVCGITSTLDAEAAIEAGVSAIGLVFATSSPRQVTIDAAQRIAAIARDRVEIVGLFKEVAAADAAHAAIHFDRIQIHGTARLGADVRVLRVVHPNDLDSAPTTNEGEITLIDGSEGRGVKFDWERVRLRLSAGPIVIAGGLTPENVGEVIATARPFGVDVSSGVESAPGRKDSEKMNRFVDAVRRADAARQ